MPKPPVASPIRRRKRELLLRTGDLFSLSFSTWFKIMPTVLATILLFAAPMSLAIAYLPQILGDLLATSGSIPSTIILIAVITNALELAANQIYVGPMTYAAVQSLRGQPCNPMTSIRVTLRSLLPLAGSALGYALIVYLGLVALIVPGCIAMSALIAATPIVVCENRSAVESLKRSAELTKGHRVEIFVSLLLISIVTSVVAFAIGWIVGALTGTARTTAPSQFMIYYLATVVTSAGSVFAAVVYFALRRQKDGVEVDEIAKVFE